MMKMDYQENSGKRFLVIEKQEEQEIDTVTLGMLENNEIKEILPFYQIQQNNDITFQYDVTGYDSIQDKLSGIVTKADVLEFLKAISDVCTVCDEYMIETSQIMLDPQYIYTDSHNRGIRFILLPFTDYENHFFDTLRTMVLGLQFDKSEDCTYVAELLSYFQHNNSFSAFAFSNMVKEIESYKSKKAYGMKKESYHSQKPEKKKEYVKPKEQKIPARQILTPEIEKPEPPEEDDFQKPGKKAKKKGLLPFGKKKNEEPKAEQKASKKKGKAFGGIAIPGVEDGGYSKGSAVIPDKQQNIKAQDVELNIYLAPEEDFGATEIFRKDEDNRDIKKVRSYYSILRTSTGERYEIYKPITKIGRKNSLVDICITGNKHVGREHAFLYKNDEGLFIEDNGSTNKTFVNSPLNEAKGKVLLQPGDTFYLGNEEFEVE